MVGHVRGILWHRRSPPAMRLSPLLFLCYMFPLSENHSVRCEVDLAVSRNLCIIYFTGKYSTKLHPNDTIRKIIMFIGAFGTSIYQFRRGWTTSSVTFVHAYEYTINVYNPASGYL